ncbi:MAG: hypothetical protein ACP5I3_09630 [Thermoproteus sp.]
MRAVLMDYLHDLSDEGEEASLDVSLFLSGWLQEMNREFIDVSSLFEFSPSEIAELGDAALVFERKVAETDAHAVHAAIGFIDGQLKRAFSQTASRSSEGVYFRKSVDVSSIRATRLALLSGETKDSIVDAICNYAAVF